MASRVRRSFCVVASITTWPSGTLQESTNVSGTYTEVLGASSPYTNAIAGPQKYFRVKVQ